jgi:hypothetical protein
MSPVGVRRFVAVDREAVRDISYRTGFMGERRILLAPQRVLGRPLDLLLQPAPRDLSGVGRVGIQPPRFTGSAVRRWPPQHPGRSPQSSAVPSSGRFPTGVLWIQQQFHHKPVQKR